MDQVWGVVATVGGWITAAVVGLIAAFVPKKGSLENIRIDQYQEDHKALTEQVASLNARLDTQNARIERTERALLWYQRRDVAWERREAQLIIGVEQRKMPPWPPREGILTEASPI